ncbi:hypothetical protein AMATHDRAFT_56424 [Amanita thiersii Skay4041]|uniref:Uncharacterized protein n=1 Tax=Amanita thiersii Skay4041 TaxID=703135 RepID=A0A2A9NRY3_9AGAR|nr:hypothetical protein AMATHDRAFT_56424 [Amanita thiersii Skay4041]
MSPTVIANNIDISRTHPGQRSGLKVAPQSHSLPSQPMEQKKGSRRSNKPIINWLHRKLVGSVRKSEDASHRNTGRVKGRGPTARVVNRNASPIPSQVQERGKSQTRTDSLAAARRKTVSLNGEDESIAPPNDDDDDASYRPSSAARESTWSPASVFEADDDASVRPLPPSMPPSPSPSRSSSSYLSHPHTFRSIAASTKPTTLLSIDLNGNGMAHIAQAPLTPPPHVNRFSPHSHIRQSSITSGSLLSSGASITFSALNSSRPTSTTVGGYVSTGAQQQIQTAPLLTVQAPLHTTHHPRNNPRPSSPPLDNASVLTLASSAFGLPGRHGIAGYSSAAASALGAGDSVSHFDGSVTFPDAESTSIVIEDDDRLEERDLDASVRALRPRSSRRGSWESEVSGWSARIQLSPGTPSLQRDKSVWTTNSVRTEGLSGENADEGEDSAETGPGGSMTNGAVVAGKVSSQSDRQESLASPSVDKTNTHELVPVDPRSSTSTDTVGDASDSMSAQSEHEERAI